MGRSAAFPRVVTPLLSVFSYRCSPDTRRGAAGQRHGLSSLETATPFLLTPNTPLRRTLTVTEKTALTATGGHAGSSKVGGGG